MATAESSIALSFLPAIPQKHCTKCLEWYHATKEYFYWRKDRQSFRARCVLCCHEQEEQFREQTREALRKRSAAWRAAHPLQDLASKRKYAVKNADRVRAKNACYRKENPEKLRASGRDRWARNANNMQERTVRWRAEHPQQIQASQARYRLTHKDRTRASSRRWRVNHPEEAKALRRLWRARKRQAPLTDLTAAQWRVIQEAFEHRCAYCGKRDKGHLTQDHILALSQGGSHTLSNVVPACQSCNSKKNAGPVLKPVQPLLL